MLAWPTETDSETEREREEKRKEWRTSNKAKTTESSH